LPPRPHRNRNRSELLRERDVRELADVADFVSDFVLRGRDLAGRIVPARVYARAVRGEHVAGQAVARHQRASGLDRAQQLERAEDHPGVGLLEALFAGDDERRYVRADRRAVDAPVLDARDAVRDERDGEFFGDRPHGLERAGEQHPLPGERVGESLADLPRVRGNPIELQKIAEPAHAQLGLRHRSALELLPAGEVDPAVDLARLGVGDAERPDDLGDRVLLRGAEVQERVVRVDQNCVVCKHSALLRKNTVPRPT